MDPVSGLINEEKKQSKKLYPKIEEIEIIDVDFDYFENDEYESVEIGLCEINKLCDSCLIEIFRFLPIKDRIKIERTCRRWQDLSKLSWSNFKKLNLLYLLKDVNLFKNNETILDSNQIVYQLLTKCGKFLSHVDIDLYGYTQKCGLSLPSIIYYLAFYCENISDLKITGEDLNNNEDIYFGFLFLKNKNLKSVMIKNANINGNCLLSLPCNNIEKLIFIHVNISIALPNIDLYFKKLKVFKLFNKWPLIVNDFQYQFSIIGPEITEFVITNPKRELSFNFGKSISEMKNLKTLKLGYLKIVRDMLTFLPSEFIEKFLLIKCEIATDDLIYCLTHFKKLSGFGLQYVNISESLAESFSFNKNLKFLALRILNTTPISATTVNKLFKNFSKLEVLDLSHSFIDDHFLAIISLHCKSITAINLNNCKSITDTGLIFITSLPELEILSIKDLENISDSALGIMPNIKEINCFNCNKIGSEGLCKLLKTSPKLEKLDISGCSNINVHGIIYAAKESKNIRNNKAILKIFRYCNEFAFKNYIERISCFPNIKLVCHWMERNDIFSFAT